jgi:predicted RNA-binding protein with RPS1 domain
VDVLGSARIDGLIVLSREKAEKIKIWEELSQVYEKGAPISGMILGRTKGGLIVDIGVRAFLPGSQVDLRPVRDLDKLIGKAFPMKIIKLNQKRGNIVLSRRELLEEERKHLKEDTLATLAEGKRVKGKIKNITEYGASWIWAGSTDCSYHRHVLGAHQPPLGDFPGRRRDRGGRAQVRPDQRARVAGVQAAAARSLGGGGAAVPGRR